MCIHMLNMLIAIMGESFSQNNEIAAAKKRMQQLAFVVDNWWIDPISADEKQNLVYIIGGFHNKEEDSDENKFNELR